VEIEIETASIDFGHAKLNEYMAGPEQLDAKKFPTLRYMGSSSASPAERRAR